MVFAASKLDDLMRPWGRSWTCAEPMCLKLKVQLQLDLCSAFGLVKEEAVSSSRPKLPPPLP